MRVGYVWRCVSRR